MARILVADDEPTLRDLITILCQDLGYEVKAVATEDEAVALHASFAPDLMILDARMPGGGAQWILEDIEGRGRALGCPVLLVSGDPDFRLRGLPTVPKPFNIADLKRAVQDAVEG